MTYVSMSIDRRADYYTRCAALIAADPLDFYTRAEKGRQFQVSRLKLDAQSTSTPASAVDDVAWQNGWKNNILAMCAGAMAA